MNEKSVFETLNEVNVSNHIEKKKDLSYLSWAWAWAEVKKVYPDATYEIERFENNLPYVFDEETGYMVFTKVTIDAITHEMWLPVMDANNKAMKSQPYTYDTKMVKGIVVEKASMFDINKTIMRCLTKNLAMFGLGLYIYAGEDLPECDAEEIKISVEIKQQADELGINLEKLAAYLKKPVNKLNDDDLLMAINRKKAVKENKQND